MLQKKSKKILIYFFLFLMIGTFNNKNLSNVNFLKVKEISINGLDDFEDFKLINEIKFLKLNNLFFLNKTKISEIMDANNLVENYYVFKKYPSTLNIKINKTTFLAELKKDNKNLIIGSNGKLIEIFNDNLDLPFIFGDFQIEKFFELKAAIDKTNLNYNDIIKFYYFKSGRWDIEIKDGILIKLPKDKIVKSLELLPNFLNKSKKTKIKKIDLRQNNQIIING